MASPPSLSKLQLQKAQLSLEGKYSHSRIIPLGFYSFLVFFVLPITFTFWTGRKFETGLCVDPALKEKLTLCRSLILATSKLDPAVVWAGGCKAKRLLPLRVTIQLHWVVLRGSGGQFCAPVDLSCNESSLLPGNWEEICLGSIPSVQGIMSFPPK